MFGYLQEEIIGETVVSWIVPEEIHKEAECFSDLIAQGQTVDTVRIPKDCERIDESLLPVRLRAFPLVLPTSYSYYWNLSFDQAVENTQTLNIRYVGAAGQ